MLFRVGKLSRSRLEGVCTPTTSQDLNGDIA
jgi:hypothetical protein